ncbi:MAG: EAL domain-containing response regulator [Gammaproteobacteria bacterium]|nr:EAL domain-containing response regulator [Gammaproteobacteria bacterium]
MKDFSVLIIDDSATQREMIARICREGGIQDLAEAENGRDALNKIEAHGQDYDLLICDLEMPDVDGIELISLLSKRKTQSGIVILSSREESLLSSVELMGQKQGLWILGSIQKPLMAQHIEDFIALFEQKRANSIDAVKSKNKTALTVEEIKEAINSKRLVLHYQPKIYMESRTLSGVECLVRIQDGDQIIFPDQFIPICEENQLIDEVSYEVVRIALLQKKEWREMGLPLNMSINLSAKSFNNNQFCESLINIIRDMGADAKKVIFEVTETAIIEDLSLALSVLNRLRLAGCGLSMDDYGTGYSSIQQVSQIPFTEIKLDRSLIDGITSKPHLQVIYDSTISMCNKLGMSLVAEGVEKREDWLYLKEHGCHIGQGYYFSPPMPHQDLMAWYAAGMPSLK